MTDPKADAPRQSITPEAARHLATTTKTVPQMVGITPRWLLKLLPYVNVESGTYRINRRRIVVKRQKVRPVIEGGKAHVRAEDLRAIPVLHPLADDLLQSLAARFVPEQHGPGTVIVKQGDAGDKFYIVADGKVEVNTTGAHGERLRLGVLGPGDWFGEIALIRECKRTANVQTLSQCTLLGLPQADFKKLLEKAPELRKQFEALVQQRMAELARLDEHGEESIDIAAGHEGEPELPEVAIDYEDEPREISLSTIQTVVRVHTRVTDIYNQPINQLREQLRLAIEGVKERQEWELVNNPEFGLLPTVASAMKVQPRSGAPTPDDMDELLARVWKKPAYFLAHPRAIAAFGRECTRRGVPPPTVQMFGAPFLTWRGVPLVPCNKLEVTGSENSPGRTSILLMRVGEQEQGVIGLHQTGVPGEQMPSLSVRFMGINRKSVSSYLVTLYHAAAVLTDDALGCLENVEVGFYHAYA